MNFTVTRTASAMIAGKQLAAPCKEDLNNTSLAAWRSTIELGQGQKF
jgi:hypothetical protein